MKLKNIVLVYMKDGSSLHKKSISKIRQILEKHSLQYKMVVREALLQGMLDNQNLVIVAGGDGTFLRAAQSINDNTKILGVNTDPVNKEGFFMHCAAGNFEAKLMQIIAGKEKITKLARIEVKLNGNKMPFALNEVFLGDSKPYRMSYYDLKIGRFKEYHRTSGLIAATPAGSYAWAYSAGGKKLPIGAKKMVIIAREPYNRRLNKQKVSYKVLRPGQTVEVFSEMRRGIAVCDSISKVEEFNYGDKIVIKISEKSLYVVV